MAGLDTCGDPRVEGLRRRPHGAAMRLWAMRSENLTLQYILLIILPISPSSPTCTLRCCSGMSISRPITAPEPREPQADAARSGFAAESTPAVPVARNCVVWREHRQRRYCCSAAAFSASVRRARWGAWLQRGRRARAAPRSDCESIHGHYI